MVSPSGREENGDICRVWVSASAASAAMASSKALRGCGISCVVIVTTPAVSATSRAEESAHDALGAGAHGLANEENYRSKK